MSFGKELIESAREALAIAEGRADPAGAFNPEKVDVAAIRKKLKLTQAAFADRYGLPVGTVRDWEQGRRSPDRAAIVLLSLIERNPQMVADMLAAPRADEVPVGKVGEARHGVVPPAPEEQSRHAAFDAMRKEARRRAAAADV